MSILLSRITARFTQNYSHVTRPFTLSISSSFSSSCSDFSTCSLFSSLIQKQQQQQPTTRSYWREVLRYSPNPKNSSKVQCEDPNLMALRSSRAQSAEGLLRRKAKYVRYEKPWMKRKKLKMETKYRTMEKGVNELKLYVKYIQEAKDIYDKTNRWK